MSKPPPSTIHKSEQYDYKDFFAKLDNGSYNCYFCGSSFTQKQAKLHYLTHIPKKTINRFTLEGILPEAKSKIFTDIDKGISEKYHVQLEGIHSHGFTLPGQGSPYPDCGTWRYHGCLKTEEHHGSLEDSDRKGKVYVKPYVRTCNRKTCSVCYESWCGKLASNITFRLLVYCVGAETATELYMLPVSTKASQEMRSMYIERVFDSASNKPIHVVFSVPPAYSEHSLEYLRNRVYALAKRAGVYGGVSIFHPFRLNKVNKKWFWSPHFHIIGFGWVRGTKGIYEKTGWVIKNMGVRKSVFKTIMYMLSHCGVHEKYKVDSWFGQLSYNKFSIVKPPNNKPVCPLCGSELIILRFVGTDVSRLPVESGEYFLPLEDWVEVSGFRSGS